jgi:hypothetical protein
MKPSPDNALQVTHGVAMLRREYLVRREARLSCAPERRR